MSTAGNGNADLRTFECLIEKNPFLRYTGTLIIGRYANWVSSHPSYLFKLVQFIVGGFNHKV